MKYCTKCKRDDVEFYKNKASPDGLQTWCKNCLREYELSPERRVSRQKYNETPKGRAVQKKYRETSKYKDNQDGYRKTHRLNFVYSITCIKNGRKYFGSSTIYPNHRFAQHKCWLKADYHGNNFLQNDYNQYGLDAFTFEVLEEFDKIESVDLRTREQYYIDSYQGEVYNQIQAVANG